MRSMRHFILAVSIISLLSFFIVKLGPSDAYLQNLGSLMDVWNRSIIHPDDSPVEMFYKSFKGHHGSLYRPLSVWMYSLVFRKNVSDVERSETCFIFLTFLCGISIFTFLFVFTKNFWLSFITVLAFMLLPPFQFIAWKSFDTNLIGIPFVFLAGTLFLLLERRSYLTIPFLILSFMAILSGEASRFFLALVIVCILFTSYSNFKIGAILTGIVLIGELVFIFVLTPGHSAVFKSGPIYGSRIKDVLYYSTFFTSNFVHSFGVITFLSIIAYLFPLRTEQWRVFFILPFVFIFPVFPYRNFEECFTFVFYSPYFLVLLFLVFIAILIIKMFYSARESRFFPAYILLSILGIMIALLVYPNVRTDLSSRTLLYLYPFILFLLVKGIKFEKRRWLVIFISFSFLFHISVNFINRRGEEDALRKGMREGVKRITKMDRMIRRDWGLVQIYIDYVLRDVYFPPRPFRKFENHLITSGLFNLKGFLDGLKNIPHYTEGVYILVKRFRPSAYPFPLPLNEEKGLLKDELMFYKNSTKITELRMFKPEDTPLEEYLNRNGTFIWKISEKYNVFPSFIPEILQRVLKGMPLKIKYAFELILYRL